MAQATDNGEGSMDSMWSDSEPPKGSKEKDSAGAKGEAKTEVKTEAKNEKKSSAKAEVIPEPLSTTTEEEQEKPSKLGFVNKGSGKSNGGSGNLGSVTGFLLGDFVKTSTWPGFGPFKSSGDNEFQDSRENKMKLHAEGDQIKAVELLLADRPAGKQGLLNLQMILDFAMEALGAKPARIAEVNNFVEKNREAVAAGEMPLRTSSGDYQVALLPTPSKSVLIQLTARDGADLTASLMPAQKVEETAPQWTESNPPVEEKPSPNQTPPRNVKAGAKKPAQPAKTTIATAKTNGEDNLKKELGDVIRNWQSIKKIAVKERQTTELGKVLSGKALSRQTTGIQWLITNKKYYDLTPEGVTVDRYVELSKSPKRYAVYARVKELSKLMSENGTKTSEEETTYDVNYTLERLDDHWSIADSQVVKPGTGKSKH